MFALLIIPHASQVKQSDLQTGSHGLLLWIGNTCNYTVHPLGRFCHCCWGIRVYASMCFRSSVGRKHLAAGVFPLEDVVFIPVKFVSWCGKLVSAGTSCALTGGDRKTPSSSPKTCCHIRQLCLSRPKQSAAAIVKNMRLNPYSVTGHFPPW